jgi:hypothetical protein
MDGDQSGGWCWLGYQGEYCATGEFCCGFATYYLPTYLPTCWSIWHRTTAGHYTFYIIIIIITGRFVLCVLGMFVLMY